MQAELDDIIFAVLFIGGLIVIPLWGVLHLFKELKKRKNDYNKLDDKIEETPTLVVRAQATEKYTDIIKGGSARYPCHTVGFFVTFTLDDGKKQTLNVGENNFNRIELFTYANLVTSNGDFIDFR